MGRLRITGSAGLGGKNAAVDVKALQSALNELLDLIPPTRRLAVDGTLGRTPASSKTVAAIKLFQKKVVGLRTPDGRADVNGKTHRKINEKLKAKELSPTSTMALPVTTKTPWMTLANKEIGQAEVNGKKANPRILEYFKSSKYWGTDDTGERNAWCASFIAWVMEQSGYTPPKKAYRAKNWANFGKKIQNPVYGAIGVKDRKGGGHVAFVIGKSTDGKHLFMLGGNQEDRVQVKRYPLSVWTSFVVPINYDTSRANLPVYTKPASTAGRED